MGTGRKALVLGAGLIAAYLVLEHYTGFSSDTRSAGRAGTSLIKAFQGR